MARRNVRAVAGAFALCGALMGSVGSPASGQGEMVIRVVYDDWFGSLFKDESWTKRDERSRAYVRSGSNAMQFDADWWGGVGFRGELVDLRGATHLSLWLAGGASNGQNVRVNLKVNGRAADRVVRGLDNEWQEIRIPLVEIGGAPSARADVAVVVSGDVNEDQAPVYIDDVRFVGPASGSVRNGEPFNGGLVTFTFDDNGGGQAKYARGQLNAAGIKATFFVVSDYTFDQDLDGNLGVAEVRQLASEGHEIGAHSKTHSSLTDVDANQLEREMSEPVSRISGYGVKPRSFATPSGAYAERELQAAERFYDNHRTAFGGLNDSAADPYQIFGYDGSKELSSVLDYVKQAVADDRWAVLIYHDINPSGQGAFVVTPASLQSVIDYVKSNQILVARMDQGVDRLRQRVLVNARPNSNGKPQAVLTLDQAQRTPTSPQPQPAQPQPAQAQSANPQPSQPQPVQTQPPTNAQQLNQLVPRSKFGVVLYDEKLAPGVEDWSWAQHNIATSSPARGRSAISADISQWKGVYFHGGANLKGLTTLEFWIHGGTTGGQAIKVAGRQGNSAYKSVVIAKPTRQAWTKVRVPMAALGIKPTTATFDVQLIENAGAKVAPIGIDDVRFSR